MTEPTPTDHPPSLRCKWTLQQAFGQHFLSPLGSLGKLFVLRVTGNNVSADFAPAGSDTWDTRKR